MVLLRENVPQTVRCVFFAMGSAGTRTKKFGRVVGLVPCLIMTEKVFTGQKGK